MDDDPCPAAQKGEGRPSPWGPSSHPRSTGRRPSFPAGECGSQATDARHEAASVGGAGVRAASGLSTCLRSGGAPDLPLRNGPLSPGNRPGWLRGPSLQSPGVRQGPESGHAAQQDTPGSGGHEPSHVWEGEGWMVQRGQSCRVTSLGAQGLQLPARPCTASNPVLPARDNFANPVPPRLITQQESLGLTSRPSPGLAGSRSQGIPRQP